MNTNGSSFELVGYRFSKLVVNEENFIVEKVGDKVLSIVIASADPKVSHFKYKKRPVIELTVIVSAKVSEPGEDEREDNAATGPEDFISAHCIAGFVGREESHDGDLVKFAECSAHYVRSTYWLVRQRLASFLTMTTFRTVQLPWDLDEARSTTLVKSRLSYSTKSPAKKTGRRTSKPRKSVTQ
jgi:hypothetical protein